MSGAVDSPVTATDVDGDMLTYSVVATDATTAAIAHLTRVQSGLQCGRPIRARSASIAAAVIDFEDRSSYTVLFQVSDGEDASGAGHDDRTTRLRSPST